MHTYFSGNITVFFTTFSVFKTQKSYCFFFLEKNFCCIKNCTLCMKTVRFYICVTSLFPFIHFTKRSYPLNIVAYRIKNSNSGKTKLITHLVFYISKSPSVTYKAYVFVQTILCFQYE